GSSQFPPWPIVRAGSASYEIFPAIPAFNSVKSSHAHDEIELLTDRTLGGKAGGPGVAHPSGSVASSGVEQRRHLRRRGFVGDFGPRKKISAALPSGSGSQSGRPMDR